MYRVTTSALGRFDWFKQRMLSENHKGKQRIKDEMRRGYQTSNVQVVHPS